MKNIIAFLFVTAAFYGAAQPDTAYPFPTSRFYLHVQGQPLYMAYADLVPTHDNGQVAVLLHGKNFNAAYWDQTARSLQQTGYRVIIPEQLGFGRSSQPIDLQYSFHQLSANTKALLDSLQVTEICLVGHSMGGMLATRMALLYPRLVKKLVLVNPIGLEDWKTRGVPYMSVEEWYKQELAQTYDKMKAYQLKNYYHNEWKPAYDKWLDMQAAMLQRKNYDLIAMNSARLYDMIYTQPVCYEWAGIECPVLLIIGQKDRTALNKDKAPEELRTTLGNYPALGRITAKQIKHAELVEIENAGHLPHIETFDIFINVLKEFLGER